MTDVPTPEAAPTFQPLPRVAEGSHFPSLAAYQAEYERVRPRAGRLRFAV